MKWLLAHLGTNPSEYRYDFISFNFRSEVIRYWKTKLLLKLLIASSRFWWRFSNPYRCEVLYIYFILRDLFRKHSIPKYIWTYFTRSKFTHCNIFSPFIKKDRILGLLHVSYTSASYIIFKRICQSWGAWALLKKCCLAKKQACYQLIHRGD